MQERVRAVRGAITVERDTAEQIREATTELLHVMMERNALSADEFISLFFTLTPDLGAEFPAVAARHMGLSGVPLLCAGEIDVPGAMPRCIRVMAHCHMPAQRPVRHVYLREARQLRMDLPE
ncbi:MAG: chorismate mutase [Thermoleophilia bacterium]